jgi:hypothetical protein
LPLSSPFQEETLWKNFYICRFFSIFCSGYDSRHPAAVGQPVQQEEVVRGVRRQEEDGDLGNGASGRKLNFKHFFYFLSKKMLL